MTPALHATLVFEREIAASPQAVFAALADPLARSQWGTPSDTAVLIYDAADFREGGQDHFRCGSRTNPNIHGVTYYLDIVPDRRVISSETLVVDGDRLCVSLSTHELSPDDNKTRLKSTTQLASFVGEDMVKGFTTGTNASLDGLVRYFLKVRA
jgi:uncharacterized protein YndB with AHSA1/START domain